MGNYASRPSDAASDSEEASHLRKGRRASKAISKITLFVVIGNSALFEVKRMQMPASEENDAASNEASSKPDKKSDFQISIRQLPVGGNAVAEGPALLSLKCAVKNSCLSSGVMTTDDLASLKLHKARRNSIHSYSLNFDRERVCSKSLDFPKEQHVGLSAEEEEDKNIDLRVLVDLEIGSGDEEGFVHVNFDYQPEAVCSLASHKDSYEDDAASDCSDSSSFALQISKLAASVIESENETVEKWGEKLAKAIESKIGHPTSVVIKKSSRNRSSKKKSGGKAKRASSKKKSPTPAPDSTQTEPSALPCDA